MNRTERWVLALTAVGSFVVALDALVVATALSAIRADLHASISQLEWTVDAYVLSFAVLMMPGAALGDRFGRRRLFTIGLGVFAAASVGCALAPDVHWLIAARAVQGLGAALVMPLSLALLSAAFPPARRGPAMGIFTSLAGLAVLCGPLLGGAIVEGIAWPWIFWLNVPIALAVIPLAATRIEESRGPAAALDPVGLVLITGAVLGLVWALARGNAIGWGSAEVLTTLGLGGLLLAAFVGWERRAAEPMLPLGLFRARGFSAGNAAMFCFWASGLGTLFFMAQFMQTALGYGPLATGLRLMPWGLTTIVSAQLSGRLIGRVGARPLIVGGLGLQACAMAWIAIIASPALAYWEMVAPLVLSGTGIAFAVPAIQIAVIGAVGPESIGRASGTLSTMRQLGGAFGVAILAAVFAQVGGYASPQAFTDGFVAALGASAALSLLGALAGLVLPARERAVRPAPPRTMDAPCEANSGPAISGPSSTVPPPSYRSRSASA